MILDLVIGSSFKLAPAFWNIPFSSWIFLCLLALQNIPGSSCTSPGPGPGLIFLKEHFGQVTPWFIPLNKSSENKMLTVVSRSLFTSQASIPATSPITHLCSGYMVFWQCLEYAQLSQPSGLCTPGPWCTFSFSTHHLLRKDSLTSLPFLSSQGLIFQLSPHFPALLINCA